ncbi:lysophospholipid acyltransferase family protein [Alkalicoccus luteus]|uniref:1-acyl-sn-glycerol-3-phosphate acyltransferase n=1 Tax=Alkalicoccus luteus TaxID=1237094 RepID=A0A969PTB6_9BACI|nr:lysophospholipid acyltransferase family protein [Alkalicoccus luteus]NJP38729.1 1-acyl-sn-glycerol-3-phosphate acyltransferase [Alkalicoccus luteus]
MIRTFLWFVYFFIHLILVIPGLGIAHLLKRKDRAKADAYIHRRAYLWASSLVRFAGGKVSVHGNDNLPEGPVLFVAGHQGNFDIPIILSTANRKIGFISKVEVKKIPLIGSWMKLLDCVFIDRNDRRQSVAAIREGAEKLKAGCSLVIFPEGTRNRGGQPGQFKKGSLKLAQLSGVPIIPVTTDGSYKMMEANGGRMKPAHVTITYGEPVTIHQDKKVDAAELAALVQQKVEEHLPLTQENMNEQ